VAISFIGGGNRRNRRKQKKPLFYISSGVDGVRIIFNFSIVLQLLK
jgi:hypothetical protein